MGYFIVNGALSFCCADGCFLRCRFMFSGGNPVHEVFFPVELSAGKQCADGFHGKKKPIRSVGQKDEVKMAVKSRSLCIDCINDDSNRGDLR
jgi:hypothetical protein